MMKIKKILQLVAAILLCQSIGLVAASSITAESLEWYASLTLPFFNPPGWLSGNIWLIFYTLMGISLYMIWQKGVEKKKVQFAIAFFITHLLFNGIWAITFFSMQEIFLALTDAIIMLITIILSIALFAKIDKRAANLLIPYSIWIVFSVILNFSIWILN